MWQMGANLPVQLAVIEMKGLTVVRNNAAYEKLVACAAEYRERYEYTAVSKVEGVQAARKFFRAIGIEPTRRRPSSEALLQRALKKKDLYIINTLVDVSNWCSLDFLLPICVYDAEKINGDVTIRIGEAGDGYLALNNREINLENRYLLADDNGAFGSPMTDSQRTAISTKTKHAFLGIFAPLDYDQGRLNMQSNIYAERVIEFCGGEVVDIQIYRPA